MWEWLTNLPMWHGVGVTGVWVVTISLLAMGLVGCVVPVIPGHLFILGAAVWHGLILGEDSGVEWWTYVVLGSLLVGSQVFEWVSGAAGAKWFGGTKWGAVGAMVGALVGMFFMPFGLVLGPLIGAYGFEVAFARIGQREALHSGVGSAVGTVASLVVKLVVGILMIVWFAIDVPFIGS
ncbi:hypothetical protein HNR46_001628 [Haloferula luteola]|uniref:DUF456 domain-containing protein n=1 Tax=Haloferula luteola TaxID=595692 RepID=A0A840V050_9BACT|nr:DUF456 domain-containing protein [Haloferula luteola]MBB5351392.1 hypothetical protein [Haloferula luteola]